MNNKTKNRKEKLQILSILAIIQVLFFSLANGQTTLDFSSNKIEKTIPVAGTFLNIDTTGLKLKISEIPRVFINEKEQTVFGVEQKQLSIENYESIIGSMLKFDTIIKENLVKFEDFTGKLIVGKVNLQNSNKYLWLCYIGNSEVVIEIKGFYDEMLHSKYESSFEKALISLVVDKEREMSIYEDLPFYLDETKFPYKKELSFMPQSITILREVGEKVRMVSFTYFESNEEEIEELRKNSTEEDNFVYNDKEIFSSITKTDNNITLNGVIIQGTRLIQFHCSSSDSDLNALDEFKEMIKSINFK